MWPKALLQLLELVPHFSRLLPMADKFLQSKATLDDATLKNLGDLRAELGQANASHAGLYRQMNEQNEKLANISAEMQVLRASLELQEVQIARLVRLVKKLSATIAALIAILGVFEILFLLRH